MIANDLEDIALQSMAQSGMLSNLTTLNLRGNRFSDRAIEVFVKSNPPLNLTSLILRHNQIGDLGAIAIAESKILSKVNLLNLSNNQIGDGGAIALANSPTIQKVQRLYLRSNSIGVEGLKAIVNSSQLGQLKTLGMGRNKFDPQKLQIGLDVGFRKPRGRHTGELVKTSTLIKELTPDLEALIPVYVEKWLKVASSTTQISQERATKIVEYFYTIYLKKTIPQIVFCQNQEEALKNLQKLHKHREYRFNSNGGIVSWGIDSKLYRKLWSKLTKQVWQRLKVSFLNDPIQKELQEFFDKNNIQIGDRYNYKHNLIDASLFYLDLNPEYWLGYGSLNNFCISVLNCDYNQKRWAILQALAGHFYWTVFYQDLAIVCLRPIKLLTFNYLL